MKKIAFAGTFDPVTDGHVWVIQEALTLADKVLVIIAANTSKAPMFDELTRKKMVEESVKSLSGHENVEVVILRNEYVAQSALMHGCNYLIRGIRSALDFDYETLIQKTNTDILYGAKTLFVMPPRDLESVSSSFVKSLVGPVGWHWYIREFVSDYVYGFWIEKYLKEVSMKFCKDKKIMELIDFIKPYYNEKSRAYHNFDHLAHCMQELEWLVVNYSIPEIDAKYLCIALLGHDVIYGAKNKKFSDEELSGEIIKKWAIDNFLLNAEGAEIVKSLIEKTQHLSKKEIHLTTDLEKQMCSIDLAVLGQTKKIYDKYANNIRKENSTVPTNKYKLGRAQALSKLGSISVLYPAPEFKHYETPARYNLLQEIEELKD